ncbi:MAG: response regulator transcription factor [Fibrobacteria bacterium]
MKVLLVEDDAVTAAMCAAFLKALRHEVISVTNAESAREEAESGNFQIILCDWRLPGKSGLEFCRDLRSRETGSYPYFILITSVQGNEKLMEAMDAGIDDFLAKPLDFQALSVRLRVANRILDFHSRIGALEELIPICMYCKKIRKDTSYWESVETYFKVHVGADFTHSLCPDCYVERIKPQLDELRSPPPHPLASPD